MPRRPRVHLDGVPLHIVQRGHNREPCFFGEEDYLSYLHWLGEALDESECARVFLNDKLRLALNPHRVAVVPLAHGVDFLGYVIYPDGYKRIRRRNVRNVRRRLERLQAGHEQGALSFAYARGSIASWLGLAKHASAFRLSRDLFTEHDVRNIGKRLLVKMLRSKAMRTSTTPAAPPS